MTQVNTLQDFIASMDLQLPWLLPALETVEQTAPAGARATICVLLVAWFAFRKLRDAAPAAGQLAV